MDMPAAKVALERMYERAKGLPTGEMMPSNVAKELKSKLPEDLWSKKHGKVDYDALMVCCYLSLHFNTQHCRN